MNKNIFEDTFAAVAFAEAGEHATAMKMAGIVPAYKKVRNFVRFLEQNFAAIGFAEAGCPEEAARIADLPAARRRQRDSLDTFLETVGLGSVRVCYGFATI